MSLLAGAAPTLVLVVSSVVFYIFYHAKGPKRLFPPGPKPSWIPLVGNVKQIKSLDKPLWTWLGTDVKKSYGTHYACSIRDPGGHYPDAECHQVMSSSCQ